jgi:hypothetical protein
MRGVWPCLDFPRADTPRPDLVISQPEIFIKSYAIRRTWDYALTKSMARSIQRKPVGSPSLMKRHICAHKNYWQRIIEETSEIEILDIPFSSLVLFPVAFARIR